MNVVKVKILAIATFIKPVLVDERKLDKRYTSGYRKTGKKLSRLSVNTKITTSGDPYIRIGSYVLVGTFGKMRVIDIKKTGEIRFMNIELNLQEDYNLSLQVGDDIEVATIGFIVGESSSHQL